MQTDHVGKPVNGVVEEHRVVDQLSLREVANRAALIAGVPEAGARVLPAWVVRTGGLAVPMLRELREVAHQFDTAFVLDSAAFSSAFGATSTPFDEGLRGDGRLVARPRRGTICA